jgi:hypothetical protein
MTRDGGKSENFFTAELAENAEKNELFFAKIAVISAGSVANRF